MPAPSPSTAAAWDELLHRLGPDAQAATFDGMSSAGRVRVIRRSPRLHPDVLARVLASGQEDDLVALAQRRDLDPATLTALRADRRLYVRNIVNANHPAPADGETDAHTRAAQTGTTADVSAAIAASWASAQHLEAELVPALLADTRVTVSRALAANPRAGAPALTALASSPDQDTRLAVLHNEATPRQNVVALADRPDRRGTETKALIRRIETDPDSWVPATLTGTKNQVVVDHLMTHLSRLTPAGQAHLMALACQVGFADQSLRPVFAHVRGLHPAVHAAAQARHHHEDPATVLRTLRQDAPELFDPAAALVRPVEPDLVDHDVVFGELCDTAWGRLPLHAKAATTLPWDQVATLAAHPGIGAQTWRWLLARPDCPEHVVTALLPHHPLEVATAPATRACHVRAALTLMAAQDSLSHNDLWFLGRTLDKFGIDPLEVAAALPLPSLLQLLAEGRQKGGAGGVDAWTNAARTALAAYVADRVGNDPVNVRAMRQLGGSEFGGTLVELMDTVAAIGAPAGP